MCSLLRNKYRVESCRLKDHDYSSVSKYFITICIHSKELWFGYILNHQMILSESGIIADQIWHELPEHFSYVTLDEFVVMPNHVHGIIIMDPCADNDIGPLHATGVETLHATSLRQPPPTKNGFMASISPKPGSLATIIRSYKSAVSKNVHKQNPDFSWQPRYYDHLIRSNNELDRIRKYIIDNPINWSPY